MNLLLDLKPIKFWQRTSLFFGLLQTRNSNRVFQRIMNEAWWFTLGIYYVGYNKLQREIEVTFNNTDRSEGENKP